jgi:GT2 family glycosyltransferase
MTADRCAAGTPGVTVIIPVHGRSALTRNCLDTLLAQEAPPGTRILVVDDASPDDTQQVLASYGRRIEVLHQPVNVGFGAACNRGVEAARTELVVLLNNDTTPHPGWLTALLRCAEDFPAAAAVGARLLHLDGTVQHAGVVIGRDRLPHHVYAGFPGDHPAVLRCRPFQVVTAACVLLRRSIFRAVGGFDLRYRNGHEDVDLCLRLGAAGHPVRYCADAVLTHLESVSRGRTGPDQVANGRLWCDTWQDRVEPDDLELYASDGLLSIRYDGDTTPLVAEVAVELATLERRERAREVERLLRQRTQQVHELLQDAVRLSVLAAGAGHPAALASRAIPTQVVRSDGLQLSGLLASSHAPVLERDDRVQEALAELQAALAERLGDAYAPHPGPDYRRLVRRVRSQVESVAPVGSTVLVVSRGDAELLQLDERTARHFPCDSSGRYAGFHPADSDAVISHLEDQRASGATHLVLPSTALWWLDHYTGFSDHLRSRGDLVLDDTPHCRIYRLAGSA